LSCSSTTGKRKAKPAKSLAEPSYNWRICFLIQTVVGEKGEREKERDGVACLSVGVIPAISSFRREVRLGTTRVVLPSSVACSSARPFGFSARRRLPCHRYRNGGCLLFGLALNSSAFALFTLALAVLSRQPAWVQFTASAPAPPPSPATSSLRKEACTSCEPPILAWTEWEGHHWFAGPNPSNGDSVLPLSKKPVVSPPSFGYFGGD
jgi:hypothetical protein